MSINISVLSSAILPLNAASNIPVTNKFNQFAHLLNVLVSSPSLNFNACVLQSLFWIPYQNLLCLLNNINLTAYFKITICCFKFKLQSSTVQQWKRLRVRLLDIQRHPVLSDIAGFIVSGVSIVSALITILSLPDLLVLRFHCYHHL